MSNGTKPTEQKPIGEVRIAINQDLSMNVDTAGVLRSPHMLEAVIGYLRQYTNRTWETVFKPIGHDE